MPLVLCPFPACLFGTGRLLGFRYCCLQLCGEPLIQTTSRSYTALPWALSDTPTKCEEQLLRKWKCVCVKLSQCPWLPSCHVGGGSVFVFSLSILHCTSPCLHWTGLHLTTCVYVYFISLDSRSSVHLKVVTALPWAPSNTPAKFEVNQMNGCRNNGATDTHTQRFLYF